MMQFDHDGDEKSDSNKTDEDIEIEYPINSTMQILGSIVGCIVGSLTFLALECLAKMIYSKLSKVSS